VSEYPTTNRIGVVEDCKASLYRFGDDDVPYDILALAFAPDPPERQYRAIGFPPNSPQPVVVPIAQARTILVVGSDNPVDSLTLLEVRRILGMPAVGRSWDHVLGKGGSGSVRVSGPPEQSPCFATIRQMCMQHWLPAGPNSKKLHIDRLRDDVRWSENPEDITKCVKAAGNAGLGIISFPANPRLQWGGLRALNVEVEGGKRVAPRLSPGVQVEYPLAETFVLYVHPKAIKGSEEFIRYCLSEKGAGICARFGLTTPWHEQQHLAERRMAQVRAGEGKQVGVSGRGLSARVVHELGEEYVRVRDVVQVSYAEHPSELREADIVLDDRPIVSLALPSGHDQKANAGLGGRFCGRAMVFAVHPANTMEIARLEQARELFSLLARSWKPFSGADSPVRRYAPFASDPAAKLFHEKVLQLSQCGPITRKKTSAEVIAAVALDPQGIAFVDYTAIPKDNKAIKVLGIVTDKGIVRPEPKTILDGTWPISQQYYLYVNPKASETAKDFAKFIVSGACAEVFRKHGMVPAPPQKLEFPAAATQPAGNSSQ